MFSGIVEDKAKVAEIDVSDSGAKLTLRTELSLDDSAIGDSFCVDGVCLTLVSKRGKDVSFQLAPETVRRSTLGALRKGMEVNFERSLKLGDRIHGHFVFGHVDGVGRIESKKREGDSIRLEVASPKELTRYIVPKGSISISGVSLTIGETIGEVRGDKFSVYIVPHTEEATTFGSLVEGCSVNIEIDMLARYAKGEAER